MTPKEEIIKLKKSIRVLNKEVGRLECEERILLSRVRRYREWTTKNFNWYVDLLGTNKAPNLSHLIKDCKERLVAERGQY